MTILGNARGAANVAQGISNTVQGTQSALGRLTGGTFWEQLRPASYRGVPFAVLGGQARFGRRNAVHEYPFRDDVWVEDLGRATRRISLTAFLVGDDVIAQRERLIAACEKPGTGELIHPTLGRLTVSLFEVSAEERWDQGRVFAIGMSFVEGGQRIFPSVKQSTGDGVTSAAATADASAAADFATRALTALQQGAAVVGQAASTAASWAAKAQRAANDASNLYYLMTSLPGQFGRFGSRKGITGSTPADSSATVQSLIANGTVLRQAVSNAGSSLQANAGTPSSFAVSAQSLAAAVLAAASDPRQAVIKLASLADFTPSTVTSSSAVGSSMATMQDASGDLFRRAAVVAMGRASMAYQPTSSDDAAIVRGLVSDALDAEITIAGDQGEDGTFNALRALRAAVVLDLNTRGAALPPMMVISTGQPLPSLVLAQRLYRDPTRADELVMEASPIHPAFMPTSFKALSQ